MGESLKDRNKIDQAPHTRANMAPYALRLLLTLTLGILLVEMLDLPYFHFLSGQRGSLGHILFTIFLAFPVLYFLAYRPLLRQIDYRTKAEAALKQAKEATEQTVIARTAELTAANLALQDEINERERIEQLLQLQTAAVESAANGIVITDRHGIIQWCNPAFTRMTGYQLEEAVGQDFLVLEKNQTLPGVHRDLWTNLLEGKAWHGEIISRRKDGSQYVEEQTITPVRNDQEQISHFVAIKNDITERKQAEQALEKEQQRLFSLLNQLPAIVYLKAPDYTIRYANDRFRSRFGEPEEQLCYRLIQKKDEPCEFCPGFGKMGQDNPLEWEWSFPDGRIYQLYDYPFQDIDGQELMLQLGIDITDRKKAEKELEQRNLELQTVSQAEHEQRQLAESLARATLALNTSLEMDAVLDRILEQIQVVIPGSTAAVFLLEEGSAFLVRLRGIEERTQSLQRMAAGIPLERLPQMRRTVRERKSHIVPDDEIQEMWVQFPDLEWVHSTMMASLNDEEKVLGVIVLVSDQKGYFIPENNDQLQAFIPHAVLAIQNARLFAEVETARENLQALSRRLVEIQEKERRWIARELHDEAGQALASIKVGLRLLEKHADDPQAVRIGVEEMNRITDSVMETLHDLAVDLRPASLEHMGLVPALQQYLESYQKIHPIQVQFESMGIEERFPLDIETALFRIVQEGLTNIARHAEASQAGVLVQKNSSWIVLTIEDDGKGVDLHSLSGSSHLGLVGMRERVEMLGGKMDIESVPGAGTTLYIEVPYAD